MRRGRPRGSSPTFLGECVHLSLISGYVCSLSLTPALSSQWNESLVLKELDTILADTPRVTVLGRILRRKAPPRKSVDLDSNLKQVQAVVRCVRLSLLAPLPSSPC